MQEKGGGGEQEKIADRKVLLILFSYESQFTGALSGGTGASVFFLPGSVNFFGPPLDSVSTIGSDRLTMLMIPRLW